MSILDLQQKSKDLNSSIAQLTQQVNSLTSLLHKNMGALEMVNHLISEEEAKEKEINKEKEILGSEDIGDVN